MGYMYQVKISTNADNALIQINNIHPIIQFTEEKEYHNKSNYLDINITSYSNNLQYAIYRKPTSINIIIPNHSHHPPQYKMAPVYSLFNETYKVPINKEETDKERNIIYQITYENGYKENTCLLYTSRCV